MNPGKKTGPSPRNRQLWVLATENRPDRLLSKLQKKGFDCRIFHHSDHLLRHARADITKGSHATILLACDAVTACLAAWELSDHRIRSLLIAYLDTTSSAAHLAVVQAGIDWLARPQDSVALLGAVIHGLHARRARWIGPVDQPGRRLGAWTLRHDAWVLVHDDGGHLRLSPAERAVLRCLFTASEHTASNETLVQKVLESWHKGRVTSRRRSANLPVIVGRLRSKGRKAGLVIPISIFPDQKVGWLCGLNNKE